MDGRERRNRSWRLSSVLILLLLPGTTILCALVLPGGWKIAFWAGAALIGGLSCLGLFLLSLFLWLLIRIFAPLRPTPRGVRLKKATYFARVDALLALPVLALEYPGAVLLATADSKTGWRTSDAESPLPAATIWAEARARPVPSSPPALLHPIRSWKKWYRQRIEQGFSGYYSGEMGAGAWYGLVALPDGQAFPPLFPIGSGSGPRRTVEEYSATIRRLVSECKETDVSPQAIIAWYDQQLTAQGWRRCSPRSCIGSYQQEADWRLDDDVLTVSIYWPGAALTYRPDLPDAGRYVRIIEVQVKPREGTRWWQESE